MDRDESKGKGREIEKIQGNMPVLLIAPHGFKGDKARKLDADDINTGWLSRRMAQRLGCYAIINEVYKRPSARSPLKIDPRTGRVDLNRIGQVEKHLKGEFLTPIREFTDQMVKRWGRALVNRAYGTLSQIFSRHFQDAMTEAGQYLIEEFYGGDIERARRKEPVKEKSLHQLIQMLHAKDSNAPSKSWVYNAVNLVVQENDFARFHTYGKLPLSHKVLLLPISNEKEKRKMIEEAAKKNLTVQQFRERIGSLKDRRPVLPPGLNKLIDACQELRSNRMPAIVYLGAEHGASKQEILDLKWSDIDFGFEGIGLIRFFRTKNGRERTEYLMPRTKQALLEWREHQDWMRGKKKIEDKGPVYVFCRLDGRRLNGFVNSWRTVCEIAGFPKLHFHDLRHTFCSTLILSGGDLKDAKEMIGHRDLKMTDRYSHLTSMRKRAKQMDLARFYANGSESMELSGEHIGNTEAKNGLLNEKRAD